MASLCLYRVIILPHASGSKGTLPCHPHTPARAGSPPAQNEIPDPRPVRRAAIHTQGHCRAIQWPVRVAGGIPYCPPGALLRGKQLLLQANWTKQHFSDPQDLTWTSGETGDIFPDKCLLPRVRRPACPCPPHPTPKGLHVRLSELPCAPLVKHLSCSSCG